MSSMKQDSLNILGQLHTDYNIQIDYLEYHSITPIHFQEA